ncbi:MAG: hypothetical protein HY290_09035 [Planctomycetia bacterium]|nr:hypothetical protein [Planctomycetia bacterium]
MAKRTRNIRELREQADAAEKQEKSSGEGAAADKKKTKEPKKKAPKAKRSKAKVVVRKRLVWGVFSSSMKEEGRFPFADREGAEARAVELAAKHKRTYFVQPIKEPLPEKEPAPA